MRKIKLIPIALVSLFSLSVLPSLGLKSALADEKTYYVDFFNNYLREEFTLSSGFKGKGNNLIYKTVKVNEGSPVAKPEDPGRKNYDFQGWFKEEECLNSWNFSDKITGNTRLFAKWTYSEEEVVPEPTYTPPSTVLKEDYPEPYEIYSFMNFKVNTYGILKLPTAAIARLTAHADDIRPLMEYKAKESTCLEATYDGSKIHIKSNDKDELVITVQDNSSDYVVGDANYETKAKKYEEKIESEDENYHVMLAGSSSIEYWTTSTEDLKPIVSYNHGIGGTTIEQWTEKLNQRLVYPYKPKMVVYYVGINNIINTSQTNDQIKDNIHKFFEETHAAMPDTKVQYILMNILGEYYRSKFANIKDVNAYIKEYAASNSDWLTLINPGEALMKDAESDTVNAAYFSTDNLHLSPYGYTIWGAIVKESILKGLEEMNK